MAKQVIMTFQAPQEVRKAFGAGTWIGESCAELLTMRWPSGRAKVRKPRKGAK